VNGISSSTASAVSGSKGTLVGAMSTISSAIGGLKGDGVRGSDDRSSIKRYYCMFTKSFSCTPRNCSSAV
jgi:hypothetical protein